MNNDALKDAIRFGTTPAAVRKAMYKQLTAAQSERPGAQVLGAATLLIVLAEATGLDVPELLRHVERMRSDLDSPFTHQIGAAIEYARGELM